MLKERNHQRPGTASEEKLTNTETEARPTSAHRQPEQWNGTVL